MGVGNFSLPLGLARLAWKRLGGALLDWEGRCFVLLDALGLGCACLVFIRLVFGCLGCFLRWLLLL